MSDASRCCSWLCLAAALTTAPVQSQTTAVPTSDQAAAALRQFLAGARPAHQYRASRRLEATGSGRGAWLDVQTEFSASTGLQYQVTGEGGSGYIRSRVLRSLLEEEQRLVARNGGSGVALAPDNYQFTPEVINEEGLAVVRIQPLRKAHSLLDGRMFLTLDGELLRVEGRLAKNPSFWVTRTTVIRWYRRINGALMPVSLESTAQLRLLGASTLRMTYSYSHVDDREVADDFSTKGSGLMQETAIRAATPSKICKTRPARPSCPVTTMAQQDLFPIRRQPRGR
jgi:hypothetical protein